MLGILILITVQKGVKVEAFTSYRLDSDLRYEYKNKKENEFYNTEHRYGGGEVNRIGVKEYNIDKRPKEAIGSNERYEKYGEGSSIEEGWSSQIGINNNTSPSYIPYVPDEYNYGTDDGIEEYNYGIDEQTGRESVLGVLPDDKGNITYPEKKENESFRYNVKNPTKYSDGNIGRLRIPEIDLNVKTYNGDIYKAMKKGLGYIDQTTLWKGNVALTGHNRGINSYFKDIKKLKKGDKIYYRTKFGEKVYEVESVEKIKETDWSKVGYTKENKITLITCVENEPTYRYLVQGVEK